jgi:hypothetical protein
MSRRSNLFGVGIVSASLPAWADYTALPNGQFIEFTTNTPADVGMQIGTLRNWCGGNFVPDYGTRGGVCYVGGGEHGSPWAESSLSGVGQQGVYVLDCDARVYRRKAYPTATHLGVVDGGAGSTTDTWGAYADDGSPQSKHTYCSVSYMPAAWGGGSSGSLMAVSQSGGLTSGSGSQTGYSAAWRFDLSKDRHSVADPSVFKLTGSSKYNFGGAPDARINNAPIACIDLTREGWWSTTHFSGSDHGWGYRMAFTSKTGVITSPIGPSFARPYGALHHFADDDILVRITEQDIAANGVVPTWRVYVWQAGTSDPWQEAALTRQSISDLNGFGQLAYVYLQETQPRWSSILGAFVWIDSQYPWGAQPTTTIRVWKLTPPPAGQRVSGTWTATWELVTAKPGTEATNRMNMVNGDANSDGATMNGTYGRFLEVPSLRAFAWTREVNKPGQLIRLQGM